jgi:hypothetical protein
LLTGNPGPDNQLLLQKYFARIIAGVTNTEIVVDPDGFVPLGGRVEVPYNPLDRSQPISGGPARPTTRPWSATPSWR